ncbi:hypothetical protein [Methylobacterium radiodurans]|uniref:Uncharacterized protein n=1 Tax=Methylobacterium radiodurans TaxID=2202828 RepID=A0A2U8VQE5_9HYPH|nr:hypothetical protein [Methylobacterium radiodurans]AWN35877.1 hypothetical protein DK427_09100 [Methylobacterium radiodurans]
MTTVVRFPHGRRMPAATIPREEFERLAELALDVVDRIVLLLDQADGDPDAEDGGDAEPSLGAPAGGPSQRAWAAGNDRDLEVGP